MPELELWEKKAIGRAYRFVNTGGELLSSAASESGKAIGNLVTRLVLRAGAYFSSGLFQSAPAVEINGKKFREKTTITQEVGTKVAGAASKTIFELAEDAANSYFTRGYFYPDGPSVASTCFEGRVQFDEELALRMFNSVGYAPDFNKVMQAMHKAASKANNSLTDITWRKQVMPHIIRTTYQQELSKCLTAIRKQHEESNSTIYNRQLMEVQMDSAAQQLGDIFTKFSRDLANRADYLEAPVTLYPQKPPRHENIPMTDKERDLLNKVSRTSLFNRSSELKKQISQEAKKLPVLSPQTLVDKLRNTLNKPAIDKEGKEYLYSPGIDPDEDGRRLVNSVLNLRELVSRSNNRTLLGRYLTREGRAERAAIKEMKDYIVEILGPGVMSSLQMMLDPSNPLERGVSISDVLHIERKVDPPEPVKTTMDNLKEVVVESGKLLSETTDALVSGSKTLATGAVNMVKTGTQAVVEGTTEVIKSGVDNTVKVIKSGADTMVNLATETADFVVKGTDTVITTTKKIYKEGAGAAFWGDAFDDFNPFDDMDDEMGFVFNGGGLQDRIEEVQARQLKVAADSKKEGADKLYKNVAKLMYLKTLEVSLKEGSLSPDRVAPCITDQKIDEESEKIMKDRAFKSLSLFKFVKGKSNGNFATKMRDLLAQTSVDHTAVNATHREYMQLRQPVAQKPQEPAKAPPAKEAPPKEPAGIVPNG